MGQPPHRRDEPKSALRGPTRGTGVPRPARIGQTVGPFGGSNAAIASTPAGGGLGGGSAPPARTGRHSLSAGRILSACVLCFALWLFFDARQLYQSAVTAPIGVRRSVAMSIMRPIAKVEETLSFDRVVDAANRVIGKTGTPGGSALGAGSAPTPPASGSASGRGRGTTPPPTTTPKKATGASGVASTTSNGPPPIAQPTAAHPLTILDIGDSIGEDLGLGLADEIGGSPEIHLIQASVGDTGLANLGYYDWLAQLPVLLAKDHPKVVVVMLGGNDGQSFQAGNQVVQFGTPAWHQIYPARVADLMSEATRVGAHVIWVGLPIMGPTSGLSNADIAEENTVFSAQAKLHPGVTFVSSWKLFANSAGQYSTYLELHGGLVEVRDPDEVHIDPPGGTDLIGSYVVAAMEADWHIKL